jgi:hypothetical protein
MSPNPTSEAPEADTALEGDSVAEKPTAESLAGGEVTVEGEPDSTAEAEAKTDDVKVEDAKTEDAEPAETKAEEIKAEVEDAKPADAKPEAKAELKAEVAAAAELQAETDAEADPESEKPATEELVGGEVTDVDDVDAEETDEAEIDAEYEVLDDELPPDRHATAIPLVGTLLALAAIAALLVGAFAWPNADGGPRKLPIGVAGTGTVTSAQLKQVFTQNDSKTFSVHEYASEAALTKAIKHHKIYGGFSVSNSAATMFIATAASPTAASALNSVATGLSGQNSGSITVTDVVPMPEKDPRGTGLAAAELPLVLVALAPAIGMVLLYRRRRGAQLVAGVGASVAVGLVLALVFNYVSGSTSGSNYWFVAAGLALGVLATTLILLGLDAIAGRIGLGIGVAVLVLVAAPLSGLNTAPEWLPNPWGKLGQLLPAGANATMLRSTAFFNGHGAGEALLVMIFWAVVGLLLVGLGTVLVNNRPVRDSELV